MRPLTLPLFLLVFVLTTAFAAAQDETIIICDFSDISVEKRETLNLVADSAVTKLVYHGDTIFEIVNGPSQESKAVRLDTGWFEPENFELKNKPFTVEMFVRIHEQGKERGSSNAANGTLFGLGDGYWSGTRLTFDSINRTLNFGIGRPQPQNAFNIGGSQSLTTGVWASVAASWDGSEMSIFVNGFPYAFGDYNGEFAKPNWGLRFGFNNAGVGSLKMDIAKIAVYSDAVKPGVLLQNAVGGEKLDAEQTKVYENIVDAIKSNDWGKAGSLVSDWNVPDSYRFTALFLEAEIAIRSGQTEKAYRIFAEIAEDDTIIESVRETALRRCIPTETTTPLVAAKPDLYRRLLEIDGITETQKKAIAKAWASSFLVNGKVDEAKQIAAQFNLGDELAEYENTIDDLIEKRFVIDYRAEEKRAIAAEKARITAGKSPWEPVEITSPFEPRFKPSVRFFVASNGNADNPGTIEKPFSSLVQARDAIRKLRAERNHELPDGGVEVVVRGGNYSVRESFELDSRDTATENSPIVYRNYENETPIFSGSVKFNTRYFTRVSDPAILERLPEESRTKVLQLDLVGSGISATGLPMRPRGYGANGPGAAPWVDLYVNDKPLQIARFPNEPDGIIDEKSAFLRTGEIISEHKTGVETKAPGEFAYTDARHGRWTEANDVWLFGYWKHLWAATSIKVSKIDKETNRITVETGANPYGYVADAPYYAFNLLEEIDKPGEWFWDRTRNIVYVYPPNDADFKSSATKIKFSVLNKPMLQIKDVSHTTFLGLVFEEGCSTGAVVEGGERFWFAGCTFERFGVWGISMRGTKHGVLGCNVFQLGGGGISIRGGEERTLTPGNCFIENCHIADLTRVDRVYGPAISLDGVGNRIAYNLMHHSPAHGMRMAGFENVIEFNEIHSMVYESDDQSGIDMFGNPTLRGNVIRYNFWHHIGSGRNVAGQSGIRLDDMISSTLMYGNVFYRSAGGQFGGIQIHGGKDNISDNNLFIDCKSAFSFSPWNENRWLENLEKGTFANLVQRSGVDITEEPFASRYPDYKHIRENANRNYMLRNIAVGCGVFARNDRGQNVQLDNLSVVSAKLEQNELGRFVIPYDWPMYDAIRMRPLPTENMGIYRDPTLRKTVEKSDVTPRYVLE